MVSFLTCYSWFSSQLCSPICCWSLWVCLCAFCSICPNCGGREFVDLTNRVTFTVQTNNCWPFHWAHLSLQDFLGTSTKVTENGCIKSVPHRASLVCFINDGYVVLTLTASTFNHIISCCHLKCSIYVFYNDYHVFLVKKIFSTSKTYWTSGVCF